MLSSWRYLSKGFSAYFYNPSDVLVQKEIKINLKKSLILAHLQITD